MKIVMLSVMSDGKKINLNPGDVVDTAGKNAPFDDAEAERLVSVGGARAPTREEVAADLETVAKADQAAADAAAAAAAAAAKK